MKNLKILVSAAFVIVSFSACNQTTTNKSAADTQGNCTGEYVDSFNRMVADAQVVAGTDQADTVTLRAVATTMDGDCNEFFTNYGNASCTATVADGHGGTIQVDTAQMKQFCDVVHNALNGTTAPAEMNAPLQAVLENTSPLMTNF